MSCECLHPDSLLSCGTRAQAAALYADARRRCPEHGLPRNTILQGDVRERLRELPDESVHCVVTSPPYWSLRDYGVPGQLGLEATPEEYVENMVAVFREIRRVLRKDGVCWLNLGDSYYGSWQNYGGGERGAGKQRPIVKGSHAQNPVWDSLEGRRPPGTQAHPTLKPKDLVGIPWRVAFALQADGWWLRSDVIWSKPNPMPESVTDRPTKSHEYIFLLTKAERYYYDADAIKEPSIDPDDDRKAPARNGQKRYPDAEIAGVRAGSATYAMRNKRTVWEVATQPYTGAHFATYPEALVRPCILAGCPEGGIVLDPFFGSGTTGLVAAKAGRDWIGIELNPEYVKLAEQRLIHVKARLL